MSTLFTFLTGSNLALINIFHMHNLIDPLETFQVVFPSGFYTIEAADSEDAAWQAAELSKDLDEPLLDVIYPDSI